MRTDREYSTGQQNKCFGILSVLNGFHQSSSHPGNRDVRRINYDDILFNFDWVIDVLLNTYQVRNDSPHPHSLTTFGLST